MTITRTVRLLRDARRALRLLGLAAVLTPAVIAAQAQAPPTAQAEEEHIDGPSYGRITLLFTQSYDTNIFVVPDSQHPQSDLIARFGPIFEVGRRTRRLTMTGRYGMAAERYFQQVQLDSDVAGQNGSLVVRYRVSPRTEWHADGLYIDTLSPRDLNTTTLLTVGRVRSERTLANGGVAQDLTERTRFLADYNITNDILEERANNLSQQAHVGFAWQKSPRSQVRLDLRGRVVDFNGTGVVGAPELITPGLTGRGTTEVLTVGWMYTVTPLTVIEVDGGPRLTDGQFRPEFSGTVRRRMQKGEISATYLSTQDTSFGEVGFFDVQRVSALLSVTPVRSLTLAAIPAFARTEQQGQWNNARELDVQITIRVLRSLSVVAAARAGDQWGTFNDPNDPIHARVMSLSALWTLP